MFVPCFVIQYFVSFYDTITLMGKRELVALLCLSFWCLVTISFLRLFLSVPCIGLQCVTMVFPDHASFSVKTFTACTQKVKT